MKHALLIGLLITPALLHAAIEPMLAGPPILLDQHIEDRLPGEVEAEFIRAIESNITQLGLQGQMLDKNAASLILPLRPAPPFAVGDRHGVSNFVDHNAAFPNFVRDYECGSRTYDTAAGYNHAGTDYFTWPFSWQGMAQNALQVRAAAGGTIVHRVDGFFDRNCSLGAPNTPNAVFVRHADGTIAWYLHLKRDSLTPKGIGETVVAGEILGEVGSSGISTGPHLHFELRSATQEILDPYNGQCNARASRWDVQAPYRDSRLLAVATHHAPPVLSQSCGAVETPNYRDRFAPGEQVYATAYFRDLRRGEPLSVQLLRPDGSVHAQSTLDTSPMTAEYFNGAYWYASVLLAEDVPAGMWRARFTYANRSVESRFAVGGHGLRGSGAWYDAAQSGQGLVVEVVDIGQVQPRVVVSFYAYREGEPVWMVGSAPLQGNSATVPMQIGSGAQFPPDFDPTQAQLQPWGQLTLNFSGPDTLTANWTSTLAGFSNGSLAMTRLTTLADINTDGFDSGVRACLSGSWYDPGQSGHGLQLQIIGGASNRVAAAIWYAYRDGKPFWINGVAPIPLTGRMLISLEDASGSDFPPNFNPSDLQRRPWGEIEIISIGPNAARLSWTTEREGFAPTGEINLTRLTQSIDATCR